MAEKKIFLVLKQKTKDGKTVKLELKPRAPKFKPRDRKAGNKYT